MTTLDRMFFLNYVRNFLIVLVCLLGLYVVVDLFMNLNDFTKNKAGLGEVAEHIGGYYMVQLAVIYDRLAELVTLAAAVFTAAWMQRNNELLPQLSAGVPTRRVIRPILIGVLITTALAPLNTEFYIPAVADRIPIPREDFKTQKPTNVKGAWDTNGDHIEGETARRPNLRVKGTPTEADRGAVEKFEYTATIEGGGELALITAERAVYIPPDAADEPRRGGWKLYNASPQTLPPRKPTNVEVIGPKQYFIRTAELDFETVARGRTWYQYANTMELWGLLDSSTTGKQSLAVSFHQRLVRPLNGLLLAVLGLAVILKDHNRHVFISAGLCLILAVLFSAAMYGAKYLGDQDILFPALAAWLPAVLFVPLALVQFDAIHT